LKKVGNISVDRTKIHANTGKHSAVSYQCVVEMIEETEKKVTVLIGKAKDADSKPLETVKDIEKHEEPPATGAEATVKEVALRLRSAEGKKIYKKRKETVEPVFGIIKQAMGFRQFLLRGLVDFTPLGRHR
jgi:uncharacterized protein YfcZ (UPF0381/DUF406 family)